MPKKVDREERQFQILSTAIDTFYLYGLENTSMQHIADELKMGRSSLYSYFSSREQILHTALDYATGEFSSIRHSMLSMEMPVRHKIFQLLTASPFEENNIKKIVTVVLNYLVKLQREKKELDPNLVNLSQQLQGLYRDLLRQGIETNELIQHDIEHMAFILYSLTESFLLQETLLGTSSPFVDAKTLQLILQGIMNEQREG